MGSADISSDGSPIGKVELEAVIGLFTMETVLDDQPLAVRLTA